ncbi:MAG: hypothetical protein GYA17_02460 [Chloroflexi bacterium]|nr:hypothetical protein [Chloroflexota bacterium]
MSADQALQGLSCPRCGGMVPIPEGQSIVVCPYCELRSVVQGEKGVRRYQVPARIDRDQALEAYRKFLAGSWSIARDCARTAQVGEVLLAYLPFWAGWGRGLGWTFGRKQVGSGDHKRYEPREVRVVEDLSWNSAACDVGEFGANRIGLEGRPLEAFDADRLHLSGLVFEPVGSAQEALEQARTIFENQVRAKASLDQVSQSFVRVLRPRLGLIYYPLWVVRYLYRGRAFQVVVDGFSGEVLYGKAPGNVFSRAAILVGGMALGSLVGIDLAALALTSSSDSDGSLGGALALFVIGLGIMYAAYHHFRYGEHYVYQRYKDGQGAFNLLSLPTGENLQQIQDLLRKIDIDFD